MSKQTLMEALCEVVTAHGEDYTVLMLVADASGCVSTIRVNAALEEEVPFHADRYLTVLVGTYFTRYVADGGTTVKFVAGEGGLQ